MPAIAHCSPASSCPEITAALLLDAGAWTPTVDVDSQCVLWGQQGLVRRGIRCCRDRSDRQQALIREKKRQCRASGLPKSFWQPMIVEMREAYSRARMAVSDAPWDCGRVRLTSLPDCTTTSRR